MVLNLDIQSIKQSISHLFHMINIKFSLSTYKIKKIKNKIQYLLLSLEKSLMIRD